MQILNKTLTFIFLLFAGSCSMLSYSCGIAKPSETAIMTYVATSEQEREVKALVKSIRELGKDYNKSEIFIVLADPINIPCISLKGENINLLQLTADSSYLKYPLAVKAFAAALVEKNIPGSVKTLIWFDPGVIILNSLDPLDLMEKYDVAFRPVTLVNTIGLPKYTEPDSYWSPIYITNNLDYKKLSTVKTVVDEADIQPYYNCEVYSVNPALRICSEWASQMSVLLDDENYQKSSCTTFRQRLFLHQAVLSAIVTARVKRDRIKPVPLFCSYPFNQHERLPQSKKAGSLNELTAIIFDYAWDKIPAWMEMIPAEEPLKSWLSGTYREYLGAKD